MGPDSALVVPTPSAPIPDVVDVLLHFPDFVSPSSWLLWVIEQICGTNPVEWVTEHFSGDWEKMSTASSALEHLATYHELYAKEVDALRATFEAGWQGEAQTAASAYFFALAADIEAQGGPLGVIAREVDNVAQGMKSFQDMLESLLGALLDWAIAAAVSAAATAASSWTIIGGLIGGGATAAAIAGGANTWMRVLDVHTAAVGLVDEFVGLTAGYLGSIHGFSTHPLPAGSYNNTRVS